MAVSVDRRYTSDVSLVNGEFACIKSMNKKKAKKEEQRKSMKKIKIQAEKSRSIGGRKRV